MRNAVLKWLRRIAWGNLYREDEPTNDILPRDGVKETLNVFGQFAKAYTNEPIASANTCFVKIAVLFYQEKRYNSSIKFELSYYRLANGVDAQRVVINNMKKISY